MKPVRIILSLLVIFTTACNNAPKPQAANNAPAPKAIPTKPTANAAETEGSANDEADAVDEWVERYVLITDTGSNYYVLRKKMQQLSHSNHLPIDTMDRGYNSKKELIALPDNADDEMYAGDYFPRRESSTSLSIEYLDVYKEDARPKMMAVVAGIYPNRAGADSVYRVLGNYNGAFIAKARIYMGCMH